MNIARIIFGACTALLLSAPAHAEDAATLLPESLSLEVVDGSIIPDDCMYPSSITNAARFEIACVTMPRFVSSEISAQYIGELGERGWRQGSFISGGMTAIRTDENNCERVLNIFPGDFPPGSENSDVVVIWFAMDRAPRCNRAQPG